ncbi:hypothetical protein AVEN_78096-1 [Araneus ventricosus]|uniref:Uncharacterized protein n=1 Tax=Araneus ventricosus TaxID=182803 RepID=A0A4Y2F392_ARAVE|nr:hypothetical protein AVEN_78096-1 [Araneus ventricosus]
MRLSVRPYIPNHSAVLSANDSDIRKLLAAEHSPAPVVQKSDMKAMIAPEQKSVLTARGSTLRFHETVLPRNRKNNKDISTVSISETSDSTTRAPPPITNLPSASPSVAPVSEEASASPDFTDFKLVTNRKKLKKDSPTKTNNSIAKAEKISKFYTSSRREVLNTIPTKDNICTHQSALKSFETKKPTSVDTQLLPMAVLPPLEKTVLQSRESDADAEMSSSSFIRRGCLGI